MSKQEAQESSDMVIESVENGYTITVLGETKYIFTDLPAVIKWLEENIETPEKGKKFLAQARSNSKGLLDIYKEAMDMQNWKQAVSSPFINPQQNTWTTTSSTAYNPSSYAYATAPTNNIIKRIYRTLRGTTP